MSDPATRLPATMPWGKPPGWPTADTRTHHKHSAVFLAYMVGRWIEEAEDLCREANVQTVKHGAPPVEMLVHAIDLHALAGGATLLIGARELDVLELATAVDALGIRIRAIWPDATTRSAAEAAVAAVLA